MYVSVELIPDFDISRGHTRSVRNVNRHQLFLMALSRRQAGLEARFEAKPELLH